MTYKGSAIYASTETVKQSNLPTFYTHISCTSTQHTDTPSNQVYRRTGEDEGGDYERFNPSNPTHTRTIYIYTQPHNKNWSTQSVTHHTAAVCIPHTKFTLHHTHIAHTTHHPQQHTRLQDLYTHLVARGKWTHQREKATNSRERVWGRFERERCER